MAKSLGNRLGAFSGILRGPTSIWRAAKRWTLYRSVARPTPCGDGVGGRSGSGRQVLIHTFDCTASAAPASSPIRRERDGVWIYHRAGRHLRRFGRTEKPRQIRAPSRSHGKLRQARRLNPAPAGIEERRSRIARECPWMSPGRGGTRCPRPARFVPRPRGASGRSRQTGRAEPGPAPEAAPRERLAPRTSRPRERDRWPAARRCPRSEGTSPSPERVVDRRP